MIFDNLTFVAIALFVLISVFLIGTKNRPRHKKNNPCSGCPEKHTDQ